MDGTPFFSVVIPAYNSAAFLHVAVESVLGQTWEDLELVLVDDGSADDTLAKCREFARADARVRVLHQDNGGHTSARNAGLKHSTGQYILFLDSDDWLDADVLRRCRESILQNGAQIVVFGLREGQDGRVLANTAQSGLYSGDRLKQLVEKNLLMGEDGTFAVPKSLSGKVFSRELVMENQLPVPNEVLLGEDGVCFIGCMLQARRVELLEGVFYHVDVRPGSVSRRGDPHSLRRCLILLEYYETLFQCTGTRLPEQFDRLTVGMLYTALRAVSLSGRGYGWLRREYAAAVAVPAVRRSIRNARFHKQAGKLRLKQQILRHGLCLVAAVLARH